MVLLTGKFLSVSGRFTIAKAKLASSAAHAFGALRKAGDRLIGVRDVSEDSPQITQISLGSSPTVREGAVLNRLPR